MTTSTAKKAESPHSTIESKLEAMALAIVATRNALQGYIESLRVNPSTASFAGQLQANVDLVDYATAALAAELGWSIGVSDSGSGSGASIPDTTMKRARHWVSRGKKDSFPLNY